MSHPIRHYTSSILCALISLYLIWLTLQKVQPGWGEEMPMMLYALIGLSIVGGMSILYQKNRCSFCSMDLWVGAWFVYAAFNYWFISPYPAGERIFSILTAFLLYIVLRHSLSHRHEHIVVAAIAIGGGYEAILGLMQLWGFTSSRHTLFAVTGTFFNPGPYAGYVVVALSILTAYIYRRHEWYTLSTLKQCRSLRRTYPACLYILCAVGFYLTIVILPATWSRAAFVAYGVVLLILFYKRHKKKVWTFIGFAGVMGILLYFAKAASANGRVLMNIVSFRAIRETPICGHGIGGFSHTFAENQSAYFTEHPHSPFIEVAGSPEYAFNELMQVGVEQGVIGMLLATIIAMGSVRILLRKRSKLAFGWIALLVFSLFSYPFSLQPFRILGVMFVALAANASCHYKETEKRATRWGRILMMACVVAAAWGMMPRVWEKVKSREEWDMVAGYRDAAFVDDYEKWYSAMSDNPKFLFSYGKILNDLKRYNDSNAALRAGTMVSADPMFYVVMGNNYKALKAYREAETAYRKAFAMEPNKMYPLYQLLLLYIELGNDHQARETALKIVNFQPKVRSNATDEMQQFAAKHLQFGLEI